MGTMESDDAQPGNRGCRLEVERHGSSKVIEASRQLMTGLAHALACERIQEIMRTEQHQGYDTTVGAHERSEASMFANHLA